MSRTGCPLTLRLREWRKALRLSFDAIERPTLVADGPRMPAQYARMVRASACLARPFNALAFQCQVGVCGEDAVIRRVISETAKIRHSPLI